MYNPPHYTQTEPGQLHRIMRTHPLGVLVTSGPASGPAHLDADHIPFEFDPGAGPLGTLSAHVARANPLWQRCLSG
ncbi:MAG: FMN-binding negative transcriptional regulator, partial [Rubrivivax sp.]|nr:FMN-binding negative transcriptional regulator [Rubrivivax sp.]